MSFRRAPDSLRHLLPAIYSAPLFYPVPSEEEQPDEILTEEAPVIVPEEQAELDTLFGDLGGSLQESYWRCKSCRTDKPIRGR